MIVGIGTDVVLIKRIANLSERYGERFARRILGPNEMLEYLRRLSKKPAGPDAPCATWQNDLPPKRLLVRPLVLALEGP